MTPHAQCVCYGGLVAVVVVVVCCCCCCLLLLLSLSLSLLTITACSSMESIPIGLLDRQRINRLHIIIARESADATFVLYQGYVMDE